MMMVGWKWDDDNHGQQIYLTINGERGDDDGGMMTTMNNVNDEHKEMNGGQGMADLSEWSSSVAQQILVSTIIVQLRA